MYGMERTLAAVAVLQLKARVAYAQARNDAEVSTMMPHGARRDGIADNVRRMQLDAMHLSYAARRLLGIEEPG